MRGLVFIVAAAIATAGCVTVPIDEAATTGAVTALSVPDATAAAAGTVLTWMGARLEGPPMDGENEPPPWEERPPTPPCAERNCERRDLVVGDTRGDDVVVNIEWEAQDEDYDSNAMPGAYLGAPAVMMHLAVLQGDDLVVQGKSSGHYGAVAVLEAPAPGTYTLRVVVVHGVSTFIGAARTQASDAFAAAAASDGLLRPDLVMLPPDHLNFNAPLPRATQDVQNLAVVGCGPDEVAEDQHRRCLRFAGIVGNQGVGDLETRLAYDQAAAAAAGGGRWDQLVQKADGSTERIAIGPADYHGVHGHFHLLEFVATQLYAFDETTGERGEPLGLGQKHGFCLIDGGFVDPTAALVKPPQFFGGGCCYIAGICQLDMLNYDEFRMGMTAGWYDTYPWYRADQYVEVTGVPDGVYELVSVINPNGLLVEENLDNNEASTVFRLTGDTVDMLARTTQADVGPHPDAAWAQRSAE